MGRWSAHRRRLRASAKRHRCCPHVVTSVQNQAPYLRVPLCPRVPPTRLWSCRLPCRPATETHGMSRDICCSDRLMEVHWNAWARLRKSRRPRPTTSYPGYRRSSTCRPVRGQTHCCWVVDHTWRHDVAVLLTAGVLPVQDRLFHRGKTETQRRPVFPAGRPQSDEVHGNLT